MTPQEAGIDMSPKSPEFWRQVSMGSVFAYPAGSKSPVQLRAGDDPVSTGGDFGYTRPAEPESIPARQMKQPGLFKRILNRLGGGRWFQEVNACNRAQDRTLLRRELSEMNMKRAGSEDDELAPAQQAVMEEEAQKEKEALEKELAEAREDEKEFQAG